MTGHGGHADALARMTAMQGLLEQVQRDEAEFADLAARLGEHFARVDRLRGYLDLWLEDREAIRAADEDADLPILGEDPLWESVEAASTLVRGLLTVCAAEVAAARHPPPGPGTDMLSRGSGVSLTRACSLMCPIGLGAESSLVASARGRAGVRVATTGHRRRPPGVSESEAEAVRIGFAHRESRSPRGRFRSQARGRP